MGACNVVGLVTLIEKEIGRFMNVYMQTIVAPIVTLVLFLAVFTLSLHQHVAEETGRMMEGALFLAPGLLMMTMIQNAFANPSSSLVIAKIQGNIVDLLMPPLAAWELMTGMLLAALVRCFLIGVLGAGVIAVFVPLSIASFPVMAGFGFLGCLMLAVTGMMAGLWAEKFDHMATVTNFIITPLTFLSGTFYSLQALPAFWQKLVLFNPVFYMIDGFRAGFTGHAETSLVTGALFLGGLDVILLLAAWVMLSRGYKIKS